MKIEYIILFIVLFFLCIPICYGGGSATATYVDNSSVSGNGSSVIVALEDGHFNTSFSEGYNGYCLEYMEEEALKGDEFYKESCDYYNSSVYLKRYFVDYTDYALRDKVVTQHMIWHFTDGFDGWRVNYTIVDAIMVSDNFYGDTHVVDLGGGRCRVFDFCVLVSPYEHHQDYFAFKISDIVKSPSGTGNSSVDFNNSDIFNGNLSNNLSSIQFNESISLNYNYFINQYIVGGADTSVFVSQNLVKNKNDANFKHRTGNPIEILTVGIILLTIIILIQNIVITNGGKKKK